MATLKFTIEADYQKVIKLRNEIDRLEKQLRGFDGSTPQTEINKIERQLATSRNEFSRLATEAGRAGVAMNSNFRNSSRGVSDAMGTVRQQISGVTQEAKTQSAAIDALFSRLTSAAAKFGISLSALGLGNRIMQTRGEFQQLEVAFNTMLGSAEKGNALMQQLVHTAAITPFDLKGVAQGAKQLLAYGIQADEVNETITKLGDIAAGLSIPLNDLVYLYGTTMTQGRMFTMDLRQFQGRGVPIADALAKEMGIAKNAVGDAVTAGKVDAQTFKKAIMSLASSGSQFGGLMETQSKTITGQLSNISDAIDVMFNEIGKSSEGIINKGLSTVSYLVENYEKVGKVLLLVATAFGTYKASLMATQAMEKLKQNNALAGLEAEIAKINEEIAARERLNGVIAQQPTGGATGKTTPPPTGKGDSTQTLSKLQGDLAERQTILQVIKEQEAVEKQAKLNIAATEHNVAQSQLSIAQEKQRMAQSSLALAQQEFDVAVKEKIEAEARVLLANQEVDARKAALLQSQKSGGDVQAAKTSLAGAYRERNTAYAAQTAAQSNFDTASRNLDAASEASRTAAAQAQTAAINEQTAAENMHNAAVEKANALDALNAGETDKATIAARKEVVEIEAKTAALEAEIQRKRELLSMPSGKNVSGGTVSGDNSDVNSNPVVAEAQSRLSEQEAINAALDAELQKRVEIAQQEVTSAQANYDAKASALDLADQEYIKANENLSIAIKNKEAVDEKVKSAEKYLDELREAAESGEVDYDDEICSAADSVVAAKRAQEAAATEVATAAEAANTAEKNLNTAAEKVNTAQTELNTAQTNASTASLRMQAASETQATVARTTNTGAITGNTVAIQSNTLATKASALASKAWIGIQTLFTGAVNATKAAFNGLKAALASNPIGLIITGVTTAISLFMMFKDETDETSESVERFGEAADKTITNLNGLYTVINSAAKTSNTYKQAMDELVKICEDYGIHLDKESSLIDQVNAKRNELIALVQKEGVERQYANNVASIEQNYQAEIEKIKKEIAEEVGSGSDSSDSLVADLITQKVQLEEKKLSALKKAVEESASKMSFESGGEISYSDALTMTREYVKYSEALQNIVGSIQAVAEKEGICTKGTKALTLAIEEQITKQLNSNEERNKELSVAEKAHDANSKAARSLSGLSDAEWNAAEQARLAKTDINKLSSEIDTLLKNYGINTVQIKLKISQEGGIPDWMQGKSVKELKKLAAFYTTQVESMDAKGVYRRYYTKEKKSRTKEENATLAMQAATLAQQKQEEIDKKANQKKEKPKGKSAAGIKAEQDKKIAEENKRWSEQEAKNNRERQYAEQQAQIDIMKEGTQKTLAQLELDHKKELEQIKQEGEELLKAKQEHAKKLFEADPKNKNKDFTKTQEYQNITLDENDNAYLKAKTQSADAKYNNAKEEANKQEVQAMRDYLKEFGSYQQKRLAIAEEYAEKIKRATTEGEKKRLQKEEQKAYGDLDFEQMKKEMNWEVLFGNLNALTKKELSAYKKMLDDFRKSDKYNTLDLVNKKEFEKKYKEIVSAGNEKGGLFGGLTQAIKDYELALTDLATAQEEYNAAVASGSEEAISAAREKMTTAQGNAVSNRQKKEDAEAATYNKLMTINDAIVSLGNASEYSVADLGKLVSTVSSAFGEVAGKVGGIIGAILAIVDSIGEQDVDEWADGIATKLGTAIGSAFDSEYSLLHYVAGGLLGSSDKTLTSDIEDLTTANESLQAAIEDLADTMDDLSIPEATEALAAQLESVSKMEANTQEIMSRMAANFSNGFLGMGGSKSSNNAIDEWFRAADIASTNETFRAFVGDEYDGYENSWEKISELVGKSIDSAGDFFSLSAKEMLSVKENLPYIYEKIKELADDGYKDAAQYMDAYTEYAEQVQELEEAYQEKITATSFDTIKDDFRSALTDMDSDAEDFSNNLEKYLREAVVESLMTSLYDDRLKSWYEKLASAMESGGKLTNSERDALEEEYNDIVSDALAMRDELENMGLISDDSDSSQSSSYGESSSITQDQASEISGRLTAIQWNGEQRLTQDTLANAKLDTVIVNTSAINSIANNIRDMIAQSYLELQMINENTASIVKPIKNISEKIDTMEKVIKNL